MNESGVVFKLILNLLYNFSNSVDFQQIFFLIIGSIYWDPMTNPYRLE